jgi:hypothetical protein
MNSIADRLRNIIVQGWAGMLYLLLLMSLTDLNELGMKGDFSALNIDPGVGGLWFVVIMSCINVLVQISVRAFDGTPFRWLVFVASVIYTILFIIHQIDHLSAGQWFDMHFVIDLVHHTLGISASVAAFRWARLSEKVAAYQSSPTVA